MVRRKEPQMGSPRDWTGFQAGSADLSSNDFARVTYPVASEKSSSWNLPVQCSQHQSPPMIITVEACLLLPSVVKLAQS